MSTTLVAILIAVAGIVGVLAIACAFYLVGRAEDRERSAARQAAAPDSPDAPDTPAAPAAPTAHRPAADERPRPDHPEPGSIARSRSRGRPPRRPG